MCISHFIYTHVMDTDNNTQTQIQQAIDDNDYVNLF